MKKVILYSHNKEAYERIENDLEESTKIAIVKPTGTGKSYLITKIIQAQNKKTLLLSPSTHINNQIMRICPETFEKIETMTYSKLSTMSEEERNSLRYDLIIFDEFHRCGAETWNKSIMHILENNEGSLIIGTTATPIRHLDNERNMADELFEGNVVVNMGLAEAISKKILPAPLYISSIYKFEDTHDEILRDINMSKNSKKEKEDMKKMLREAKNNFDKSYGADKILAKYFNPRNGKTIVFCKNKEHLEEMVGTVVKWFKKAFKNEEIKTYKVLSEYGKEKNEKTLNIFENEETDKITILFSVDMVSEGLHIKGISNAIFLRSTKSRIVFMQQMGRVLTSNKKNQPLIFDFVNNLKSVDIKGIKNDIFGFSEFQKKSGIKLDFFEIIDETQDLRNEIASIEECFMDHWERAISHLKQFKEEFGHLNVPSKYKSYNGFNLGHWTLYQRLRYKKGLLPSEKINELLEIGFELEKNLYEKKYLLFKEASEKGIVFYSVNPFYEGLNIYKWILEVRKKKENGKLSKKEEEKLNEIDFPWDYDKKTWEESYDMLLDYLKTNDLSELKYDTIYNKYNLGSWVFSQKTSIRNGLLEKEKENKLKEVGINERLKKDIFWEESISKYISLKENPELFSPKEARNISGWETKQRRLRKENKLSEDKIKDLDEIGFDWIVNINLNWEESFDLFVKYLEEGGTKNIPVKEVYKGYKLGSWARCQRKAKSNNTLSDEKIKKLNELEFIWDLKEYEWNEKYEKLKEKLEKDNFILSSKDEFYGWIKVQKQRKDKLQKEKIEKLEKIGIIL